ncbi:MAG: farnesyl diphosphate synthase [bacterium]
MFNLDAYLRARRELVDAALDKHLPPEHTRPAILHRALRYSVLGGGKRIRPILCIAAAEAVGGTPASALLPAAAIEILHTYTLVHDDLPAMDNDDLRRGRPTSHKTFGEANAILAGDALLTLAFEWLAECKAPAPYPPNQLALELARAAGSQGVIGGQVEDLAAEGKDPTAALVDYIHRQKTAALVRAATRIGAISGGAKVAQLEALTNYGNDIGLAFQIGDDILNATSTHEVLGKGAGTDQERGKMTYVAVHGLDKARTHAQELVEKAVSELRGAGITSEPLVAIARYVADRKS